MKPEEKRSGRGSHRLAFPSKPDRATEYEFFISGSAAGGGDTPEKKNAEENRGETGATVLGSREDVGKDL